MKLRSIHLGSVFLMLLLLRAPASVFYVNVNNPVPTSPFTTWSTAATNIQDAIDISTDGDLILVTNGFYKAGGRVVYGSLTNRVVINKAVTVQSVNGSTKTLIQGFPVLNNFAVRCVYLTNNAVLSGFTVTNGATRLSGDSYKEQSGGGIWCESTSAIVSNCVVVNCAANVLGGGTVSGTLINCTLTNNTAVSRGGGALSGVLTNCTIAHNSAAFGGGVCSNILFNCKLTANSASSSGGGAFSCILSNCFLAGNSATNGGGAIYGTLTSCTLSNNTAYNGGGVYSNTLINCTLLKNIATNNGGGAYSTILTNCTLTGNSATNGGGGACFGKLYNCLLSLNTATYGGGVFSNLLFNCTLMNSNQAAAGGGGYESTMTSCVLSNNVAQSGGGSLGGTLNRCLVVWNQANNGSGSYGDTLNNCELYLNYSPVGGGAANTSILNNCSVIHNYGIPSCGGTYNCRSTNCIIYYNQNSDDYNSIMSYCCVLKIIELGGYGFGAGCFTNEPLFLDDMLHLQTNSPCVDAGNSSFAAGSVDIDGRPRVVGGSVDMGATEFHGASVEPFISWLYQYALPNDGSADYADSDGDNMNNWQEWIAGTIPTNAASVLALQTPDVTVSNATITWSSVTNVTYFVQRSIDLSQSNFSAIQSNIVGQAGTTSFTDATVTNGGSFFYRVGVQ